MFLEKVVYIVYVKVIGGCDGCVIFFDGILDVKFIVFKEMGGVGGGMNFEQFFVVGYFVCFLGVMKFVVNCD